MGRKRMTLPKKREDLEKIVEEVESQHHHEHGHEHHHHHHGSLEDTVTVLELLVDSLSANVKGLDARLSTASLEIARLYRVLSHIVEALAAEDEDEKKLALERAIDVLRS